MDNEKQVVVTGLNIPFWDLVVFLIKLAFASIPALFVVSFFFMLMGMLFGNIFFMSARGF